MTTANSDVRRSKALDGFNPRAETDVVMRGGQVNDATQQAGSTPASAPLTSETPKFEFPTGKIARGEKNS
jgi:hypothetical protein